MNDEMNNVAAVNEVPVETVVPAQTEQKKGHDGLVIAGTGVVGGLAIYGLVMAIKKLVGWVKKLIGKVGKKNEAEPVEAVAVEVVDGGKTEK